MKKMILSKNFSICSFFLLFFLAACSSIEYTVVFNDNVSNGAHSRGLDESNGVYLIAGSKGVFSFVHHSGMVTHIDSILLIEDFRDVEYFSDQSFLLMNSGDKGEIWWGNDEIFYQKVFDSSGVFLDGMDFWDQARGMAFGDPIDGKLFLIRTNDGGLTWDSVDSESIPFALPNEAGFAASGTGIQCAGDQTVFIGTGGGDTARLFRSFDSGITWDVVNTPMISGESFGIYSMYFWSETEGMIIGGSYLEKEEHKSICFYTNDAGLSWSDRSNGLEGYCSGLHGNADASMLVATGRVGTFYSTTKGLSWKKLFDENFYSVHVNNEYIAFSGANGAFKLISYKTK